MSSTQYRCKNEQRRAVVRKGVEGRFPVNGIDYLEVASDQKTLVVYFIHNLPGAEQENPVPPRLASLNEENVAIAGGTRIQDVRVESASSFGNILLLRVNHVGDLSTYTLRFRVSLVLKLLAPTLVSFTSAASIHSFSPVMPFCCWMKKTLITPVTCCD
jgi:hypothetical protein